MIIKPAHITPATLNKRLLGTEEEAKSANLVEQRQRTLIQYWMGSSGLLSLSDWSVLRAAIELAQATSARNVDSLLLLLRSPRGVLIDLHSLIIVLELLGLLL